MKDGEFMEDLYFATRRRIPEGRRGCDRICAGLFVRSTLNVLGLVREKLGSIVFSIFFLSFVLLSTNILNFCVQFGFCLRR